ncbi:pilus (MSHA type) biogenesis protein MshL [Methylophilus sp. 14]|uniref:pilus (MSHA type) biogenesis protein MshL n=1 Tax=Methylophilus sp. 14 TaxID=2781019 RepID=UPI001E5C5237|nr:pilus (MSHA type) biogenesis protein MshL [Methylophilus sp. 14]
MRFAIILLCCVWLAACIRQPLDASTHSTLHLPDSLPAETSPVAVYPEVDISEIESTRAITPPLKSATPTLLINLVVHDAPVQEVLLAIARESGLNIDVHPGLRGKVSLHAIQQSVPSILARMSKQLDMYYEWSHGVWLITPDMPVIRSYKLNYVNMSRDTTGYIGVASEINSAGRAAAGNGSGSQAVLAQGGNSNSSRTAVTSQSRYHLWESVVENIQALLEETDKASTARDEVLEGAASRLDIPAPAADSATSMQASQHAGEVSAQPSVTTPVALEKIKQAHVRWHASRLIANPETGILTIRASQSQQAQVRAYLESVMQVAARQVLIEATIVEVELGKSFQMGIDWSRLSASAQQRGWQLAQSLGSDAAQFNRAAGSWESNNSKNALGQNNGSVAFMLGYFNPFSRLGNLSASVTLLEQFGKTRVLSSPKLMVLNNQTAILKVVDNLVYFTIQSQISQSSSNSGSNLQAVTTTANTVPVGLVMAVTAQINSHQRVNLNVRPTVSKVLRYIEDPNPQLGSGSTRIVSSIPEIQVREMESVLNIASGNIAVLGGLMQEDQREFTDRVPGVSRLPVLGQVFTGKNQAAKKTELIVFLRPTVIGRADVRSGDLQSFQPLLPDELPADAFEINVGEPS